MFPAVFAGFTFNSIHCGKKGFDLELSDWSVYPEGINGWILKNRKADR